VKNISAFPEIISDRDCEGQYDTYSYGGMTLLDYFAGQALAGMARDIAWLDEDGPKAAAQAAYRTAAAMLEEREKSLSGDKE